MANDPWSDQQDNTGDDLWKEDDQEEKQEEKVVNPHADKQGLIKGAFAVGGLFFKGAADFLLDLVK